MSHNIVCYRCGMSLASLSLPLSRQDACPDCGADLHVCKMCRHFDAIVPKQCREDDAEEVFDKERANFCEWFEPAAGAFDPARKAEADAARRALDELFDDGASASEAANDALSDVGKLFE